MGTAIAPPSIAQMPPTAGCFTGGSTCTPATAGTSAGGPPILPGAGATPGVATSPDLGAIITQLQSITAQLGQLVGALQAASGAAALGGGGAAGAPAPPASQLADTAAAPTTPPAPAADPAPKPADDKPKVEIGKWVTGDSKGLNPKLLDKLAQVGEQVGKPVKIDSGFRSRAEQQQLYDLYKAGKGNLAAKPGSSNHESGNAADVSIGGVSLRNSPEGKAAALKLGLKFPVPSEAWHTELA